MFNVSHLGARIEWESKGLASMNRDWLLIKPYGNELPFPMTYKVDIKAKTYVKTHENVMVDGIFSFLISIGLKFPYEAPVVSFMGDKIPAHVNFYSNGNVCIGSWNAVTHNLATLALRTIRCALLARDTFNFKSPADHGCVPICRAIYSGELEAPTMPCDMPIPSYKDPQ